MKNICVLMFLAFSFSCFAQQNKMENTFPQATLIFGAGFEKFNGLNSRVANLPQYKTLPGYTGTVELGWLKERHRFVSNVGINLGSSMSGDRNQKSSTLHSAGAHADIGYDVIGTKMLMLYPLAGIGYEMYQARFYKDNSGVDFNDVLQSAALQNSISSVSFRNSFFTYRLGIGVAIRSQKYPSSSIGLQAGYTGSFSSHAWKSNENQDLNNAPVDKLSKIYVGLVLACSPWEMMKGAHGHKE